LNDRCVEEEGRLERSGIFDENGKSKGNGLSSKNTRRAAPQFVRPVFVSDRSLGFGAL